MNKEFDVHYGEEEFQTVKNGINAIQAVLMGEDLHAKERLLFYPDWYMDPYYGKDLSLLQEPLKDLLQRAALTESDKAVIEEALHLLEAYTEGPYDILEKNRDRFSEEFKPTVLCLVNENS